MFAHIAIKMIYVGVMLTHYTMRTLLTYNTVIFNLTDKYYSIMVKWGFGARTKGMIIHSLVVTQSCNTVDH